MESIRDAIPEIKFITSIGLIFTLDYTKVTGSITATLAGELDESLARHIDLLTSFE